MFTMFTQTLFIIFTLSMTEARVNFGKTTRYWDCCKPSCSWNGKAMVSKPVQTCWRNNSPIPFDQDLSSGCDGGPAFACANQVPFIVNQNLSYGFAAAYIKGKNEADNCCACYELIFTSKPVIGKKMIVQVTNIGYDLTSNHFDIAIPGGGQGIFQGCFKQYNNFYSGKRYGGISNNTECNLLPKPIQISCRWRFTWFQNADNPSVIFKKVVCPKYLLNISKCKRIT